MNKVILVGRLTKDPELKKTNADISVVQFTIAVNRTYSRNGERQADFINCVAWRGLADNLAKFMRKGNQIGVEGQLQVRTYEDMNGAKRYVTEVICENIHFLESKGSRENGFSDVNTYDIPDLPNNYGNQSLDNQVNPFSTQKPEAKPSKEIVDPFADIKTKNTISDDDLPF